MGRYSTPGVYLTEIDKSDVLIQANSGSAAIVIKSPAGPMWRPITLTNPSQLNGIFGYPSLVEYQEGDDYEDFLKKPPVNGYGLYAASAYLAEGRSLTVVRAGDSEKEIVRIGSRDVSLLKDYAYSAATFGYSTMNNTKSLYAGKLISEINEIADQSTPNTTTEIKAIDLTQPNQWKANVGEILLDSFKLAETQVADKATMEPLIDAFEIDSITGSLSSFTILSPESLTNINAYLAISSGLTAATKTKAEAIKTKHNTVTTQFKKEYTAKFGVSFASGPTSQGDNVAVSMSFFGNGAPWLYRYDNDEDIDDFKDLIKRWTDVDTTVTKETIINFINDKKLIAPKTFRLDVFTKGINDRWNPSSHINSRRYTPSESFECTLQQGYKTADGKSVWIQDIVNGKSNFIYTKYISNFTTAECVDMFLQDREESYKATYTKADGTSTTETFDRTVVPTKLADITSLDSLVIEQTGLTAIETAITNFDIETIKGSSTTTNDIKTLTFSVLSAIGLTKLAGYLALTGLADATKTKANAIITKSNKVKAEFETIKAEAERVVSTKRSFLNYGLSTDKKETTDVRDANTSLMMASALYNGQENDDDTDFDTTSGWTLLSNAEKVQASLLLVPTPNNDVKQYINKEIIPLRKRDAMMVTQSGDISIYDAEDPIKTVDTILSDTTLGEAYGYVNPSYIALYAGYGKTYDFYNDRDIWLPNAVFAGATIARTDNTANVWDSPAGQTRGIVAAKKQLVDFSDDLIGKLYDNNINPLKEFAGIGSCIWGQKTAQRKETALNRINVRRTMLFIEQTLRLFLNPLILDVNNTPQVRLRVWTQITNFLQNVKTQGGLTDFIVICDETNNTADVIDANTLNVDVIVKPVKTIEFISCNVIVASTGMSFAEARVR